jgi:hypothetical protein
MDDLEAGVLMRPQIACQFKQGTEETGRAILPEPPLKTGRHLAMVEAAECQEMRQANAGISRRRTSIRRSSLCLLVPSACWPRNLNLETAEMPVGI